MAKCNYCGKEVDYQREGNDFICPECGWEVEAARKYSEKHKQTNMIGTASSKKENNPSRIKKILLTVSAIVVVLLIVPQMCTGGGSASSSYTTSAGVGDVVILKDAFAGVTKSDLDKVIKYSVAKDSNGLMQYMLAGNAFMISDGTKAKLLNKGFASCEVRIIDGNLSGRSGWIPIEMIK